MVRNSCNMAKGVGIGLLVGAAVGMMGGYAFGCGGKKKLMKRRAAKAAESVGDLLGNVTYLFR